MGPDSAADQAAGDRTERATRKMLADAEVDAAWLGYWSDRSEQNRNRLAEMYLPIVHSVARELRQTLSDEAEFDDLVGYCCEGLLEVIPRYEAGRGAAFATFARIRIKGMAYDRLRSLDWVARSDRAHSRQLNEVREDFTHTNHRTPTADEESHLTSIKPEAHRSLVARLSTANPLRLDAMTGSSTAAREVEIPAIEPGPLARLVDSEVHGMLADALKTLRPIERQVIEMAFEQSMPVRDICAELGVTSSRVCQIRAQGLTKLREILQSHGTYASREPVLA
jgi:RNA polymerase sigma factor for flagellar operon FliA